MKLLKNSIGRIDPLKAGVALVLLYVVLITASLYWTIRQISILSHENEILVAQKETLSGVVTDIDCDKRLMRLGLPANLHDVMRFKYDPNTGTIYDNDTKEIYTKVEPFIVNTTTRASSNVNVSVEKYELPVIIIPENEMPRGAK